jgi:Ulp1 family protease
MLDFFASVARIQQDPRFQRDAWQVRTFTGPIQKNDYDCGVFVCMFMYAFITGKDLNKTYQQSDMGTIRNRLAWMFTDPEVNTSSKYMSFPSFDLSLIEYILF